MNKKFTKDFGKYHHAMLVSAYSNTKSCYILDCTSKTIKAHSITNNRLLKGVSDNGYVMYMNTEDTQSNGQPNLSKTGRGKATSFPGFCDEHDKIFHTIDNLDYTPGNIEQEFLFALRSSAKEYTTRKALNYNIDKIISESKDFNMYDAENPFRLSEEGIEDMQKYRERFMVGTRDLSIDRHKFNTNMFNKRYWKINTLTIEIKKEYKVVASSTFKLELGLNRKIINDIHNLKVTAKPFYFTVFPQNGKTYCLMSWREVNNSDYQHLNIINSYEDATKKTIVSNLLCAYVENFAVNPTYWSSLPSDIKTKFDKYYGLSTYVERVPFIFDNNFSIFV